MQYQQQQHRSVQLALDVSSSDVVLPSLIFLAGVAATIIYSNETLKEEFLEMAAFVEDEPDETTTTIISTTTTVVEDPEGTNNNDEQQVITTTTTATAFVSGGPSGKSISDLRKEVASTVQDVRATQQRLLQRSTKPAPALEPAVEDAVDVVVVEQEDTTPKKKRGILRKGFRVLKKVVAPWRKWENIS